MPGDVAEDVRPDRGRTAMRRILFSQDAAEWGSLALVFISGGCAGHYASLGMSPVQWAGAAAAVLGSVTVAVAVRVWPSPVQAEED